MYSSFYHILHSFVRQRGKMLYLSTGNNTQTAMLHLQRDEATGIYNCENIAIGNLFHRATDPISIQSTMNKKYSSTQKNTLPNLRNMNEMPWQLTWRRIPPWVSDTKQTWWSNYISYHNAILLLENHTNLLHSTHTQG